MIPIDDPPLGIVKETGKGERGRDCLRNIFFKRMEEGVQLIEGSSLKLMIKNCGKENPSTKKVLKNYISCGGNPEEL